MDRQGFEELRVSLTTFYEGQSGQPVVFPQPAEHREDVENFKIVLSPGRDPKALLAHLAQEGFMRDSPNHRRLTSLGYPIVEKRIRDDARGIDTYYTIRLTDIKPTRRVAAYRPGWELPKPTPPADDEPALQRREPNRY